jgi:hypothetical protein
VYTGMVNLVIACTAYPDQYLHQYLPQYRITVSLAGKWGTIVIELPRGVLYGSLHLEQQNLSTSTLLL